MSNKVVFVYDFDKTLSPLDMQEYGLINQLGYLKPSMFWIKVNEFAKSHNMDSILAYMYLMVKESKAKGIPLTKQLLLEHGKQIELFAGLDRWFSLINEQGQKLGLDVAHVVISAGLTSMIQGAKIAGEFNHVFASEYLFDENGIAIWPLMAVNYTLKTQYLFRINKGLYDLSDDTTINLPMPHDQRPVPFKNIIYIGDGITDVPSMTVLMEHGGTSLAVYHPQKLQAKMNAEALIKQKRVVDAFAADYRFGQPLYEWAVKKLHEIAQS